MSNNKTKILITGGTGMIGRNLQQILPKDRYETAILTRRDSVEGQLSFKWDYKRGYIDPGAFEFADIIVHLAGENISAGKWTSKQKQKIIDSRVKTGELITKYIRESDKKPNKVISASAVGYYGAITSNKIFEEKDGPGNDFLAEVTTQWEESTQSIAEMGIPLFHLRIGVVLSDEGGALKKMVTPVRLGAGSPLGSGQQWMPWISISDLSRMIYFFIENEVETGAYNAVAPNYVNNKNFMRTIASVLNKPFILPNVPAFAMKLTLGEMARIVLEGSRVSSKKVIDAGFVFEDNVLSETLERLLK